MSSKSPLANLKGKSLAVFTAVALVAAMQTGATAKNHKDVNAAIVGGIIGVAVGAALSHKHKHDTNIYYQGYRPAYPPGGYDGYDAGVYSPSPGVACYPAQRVCYNGNGSVANKWTWRVYAN